MKKNYLYPVYVLVIILLLAAAGCVEPPANTPATNQSVTKTTTKSLVTQATLADQGSPAPTSDGYSTLLPTTQVPADITCRIYTSSAAYGNNGSAFTFDLKNPPMFINYTVVPKNVTVTKVYTDNFDKKTKTLIYSDYSPESWFEITVRNITTKEIYLQDGFGEKKGYTTYLSRTLKILKTDNLLVEFRGNNIKANTSVWVKPIGNFEESQLPQFTTCTYMEGRRDTIATPKLTTIKGVIYTWTPENKVVSKAATMVKQGTQPTLNKSAYY